MVTSASRCVFVTVSPLLSAIVANALSNRIGLRLLAEFSERERLAERLTALCPDLVVIGLRDSETDRIGSDLLVHLPRARILLISSDGANAYLHQMRPHRTVLFDFSPNNLLAAIEAR